MTRLPDISNLRINNAGAEPAKGGEMTCIHDWDFTPDNDLAMFVCLKCSAKLDVVDAMNRLNMLEDDAARLRKEGDEYRAQLATRDALIERLVEAGDKVAHYSNFEDFDINGIDEWDTLVAEWQAMKGGEE